MCGPAQRLSRRLGLLGAGLLAVGILWINWGVGLIADPRYGVIRGATALTALGPISAWGWAWIGTGLLSCLGAFLPNRRTWIGLLPAVVMPCIWATAYCIARALGEFPQGLNSGFTWLVAPTLLGLLASATRRLRAELRQRRQLEREVEQLLAAASTAREGA